MSEIKTAEQALEIAIKYADEQAEIAMRNKANRGVVEYHEEYRDIFKKALNQANKFKHSVGDELTLEKINEITRDWWVKNQTNNGSSTCPFSFAEGLKKGLKLSTPKESEKMTVDISLELERFLIWYKAKQAVNTFNECSNAYVINEYHKFLKTKGK